MQVHRSMKLIKAVIATLLILAAGCDEKTSRAQHASPPEDRRCMFPHGSVAGAHCRVPLYAVLASPDAFIGKKVLTYGFLEVTESDAQLSPSRVTGGVRDSISCIYMKRFRNGANNYTPIKKPGVYSVEIAGTLRPPRRNICSAILEDVTIIDSFEEESDS